MAISLLEEETLNFWKRLVVGANITIDGMRRDYPIHHSSYIEGNQLKLFVYIGTENGHITEAKAVDSNGRIIREKSMNIRKGKDGLMVTFFFALEIKDGVTSG